MLDARASPIAEAGGRRPGAKRHMTSRREGEGVVARCRDLDPNAAPDAVAAARGWNTVGIPLLMIALL
jgi:hypothetical protein